MTVRVKTNRKECKIVENDFDIDIRISNKKPSVIEDGNGSGQDTHTCSCGCTSICDK